MTRTRVLRTLLIFCVLLLLAGGTGWVFRGTILQHGIRPLLERAAASVLDAEVRIERLAPEGGEVLLVDITVHREDGSLIFSAPAARIDFTIPGLLAGRFRSVRLLRPELSIVPAGDKEKTGFPAHPPLVIEDLSIENGRLTFPAPDGRSLIHTVDAQSGIRERFGFNVKAFAGEGDKNPFQLKGSGQWEEGLSLTIEDFQWRETALLTEPLSVSLPSEDAAAVGGAFRLEHLDSRRINEIFAILGKEPPVPPDWHFSLESPFVDFDWRESRLNLQGGFEEGALGSADVELPLEKSRWSATRVENGWEISSTFRVPAEAAGEIHLRIDDAGLTGTLHLRAPEPGELARRVIDEFRPALAGGVIIDAEFEKREDVLRVDGNFEGFSREEEPSRYHLNLSRVAGNLILSRKNGTWTGGIDLRLAERPIAGMETDGETMIVEISSVSGEILRSIVGKDLRRLIPAGTEEISADFRLIRADDEWSVEGEVAAGKIPLRRGRLVDVHLEGRIGFGVDALDFSGFRASARIAGDDLPTGDLSAEAEGHWKQGNWRLRLHPLRAENIEYMAEDGMTALAGGRLLANGTLSGSSSGDKLGLDFSGTVDAQEVLHGSFYAGLGKMEGNWSFQGTLDPDSRHFIFGDLSLAVRELGSLQLEGWLGAGNADLKGRLDVPKLESRFSELFLPFLRDTYPAARDLRLSGALQGEFALNRNPEGQRLQGAILPSGLDISLGFLKAERISGDFPFDFSFGNYARSLPAEKTRSGALSISRLSIGPAKLESERIRVVSHPNRLEVPGAVLFQVAEGRLEIVKAVYALTSKGSEISAQVDIRNIDLEQLTGEFGWVEMKGRIDADLGEIRYADDVLTSAGRMVAEVFDGILLVENIRYESPFSSYPLLYADVDFSGIDLFQLTRAFSFGVIEGIADGFVHDLQLFRLTPSNFEAVLETREEGRRSISVKALKNLTVISQGGLSAALSEGIYRFIDFYRYRKIGIWCALRRDVFVLRGTAKEGSRRYLVNGGLLPPKIDIIAPEHTISFKEMLRRLQRIEISEAVEPEAKN